MAYLIGCAFKKNEGWRALECLKAPDMLIHSTIATGNGVLWIKSSAPARPGRFLNPKTLVDFGCSTKGVPASAVILSNSVVNGEVIRRKF